MTIRTAPRRHRVLPVILATLLAATVGVLSSPASAGPDGSALRVEHRNDYVHLDGFDGPVTVSFENNGSEVCAEWTSSESGNPPDCDIRPGWTIRATDDGGLTEAVLQVHEASLGAFSDTHVTVYVDPDDTSIAVGCSGDVSVGGPDGVFRWVTETGLSMVDFSTPGPCSEPEDDATRTITAGDEFALSVEDADGDMTQDVWSAGNEPELSTDPDRGTVWGRGWLPASTVTVDVLATDENGNCTTTVVRSVETTVDGTGGFGTRTGFDSQSQCVRVDDGLNSATTFPQPFSTCTVNNDTDQVTVFTEAQPDGGPFSNIVAAAPQIGEAVVDLGTGEFTDEVDVSGSPYDFAFGGRVARVRMYHPQFADSTICAAAPAEVVDVEFNPAETGYWVITENGDVAGVGLDTPVFDDTNTQISAAAVAPAPSALEPGEKVVSMSITPTGEGYWIFTDKGRVIARGDAVHHGDLVELEITLNEPAADSVALADGSGYYVVAGDGGIFAFGGAEFLGSVPQVLPGVTLNAPVVGLVPNIAGDGYWLIASDGGIFSFGNVDFKGSIPGVLPGVPLAAPIIGALASGDAYLMFATDGGIFNFGTSIFHGSLGANANPDLITAVTVKADRTGYAMVDTLGVVMGFGDAFELSSGFIATP